MGKLILGFFLSVLFVFVFVEAGLRLLKIPVTFTAFTPCLVQEDPQFGYRFQPNASGQLQQYNEIDNYIVMNSEGFHDIEHDLTAKTNRILVLGDSFTSAGQVPIDSGWTQLIEKGVEDTSVFNMGIDGYGTDRQLKLLQHYAPLLHPDVVIVAFFENDINDILAQITLDCYDDQLLVYQNDDQKEQMIAFIDDHKPSDFAYWLAERSYFYRTLAVLFTPSGFLLGGNRISPNNIDIPIDPLPPVPDQLLSDLFEEFENLASVHDFQIYIIPVPSRDDPEQSLALLEEQLDGEMWPHIQIVDLYPQMKAQMNRDGVEHQELYFKYDGHFNKNGYALFGNTVADFLLNIE